MTRTPASLENLHRNAKDEANQRNLRRP